MVAGKSEDTALGTAHGRFLESLPRKAIELRGAIALLTATPAAEGPREDMRRRLHTLYASAVVFRNEALSSAVKAGIDCLDVAREEKRALNASDLASLARLVRSIPDLRGEGAGAESPPLRAASVEPQAAPPRASATFAVARPINAQNALALPPKPSQADLNSVTGEVQALAKPTASLEKPGQRTPLLQRVLSVLVLCPPDEREGLRTLWTGDCLEPVFVASVREALESARDSTPDVVLADERLAGRGNLLEGMRSSPLIDFVPVVVLGSADPVDAGLVSDADARLARPFELHQLLHTVGRVTGTLVDVDRTLGRLGASLTLREIADCVAEEIRHGIWDAAETGREERISLGEGAEVLAAAWGAIARVRSLVSQQSQGRVQFGAHGARSTPGLLTVGAANGAAPAQALPSQALSGRRILVADDDEAVVGLFADLLGQQGATVLVAHSGDEALRFARRERPDLVLSDILMPGLDGFGLCRKFKRDPLLAHVPILLLSWKEDLLVRMRELSVGASGYLQKEAPFGEVLSAVYETLKPRARLEEQLAGPLEVRGNLEGTGVVPLLRSVRRIRPDARVTLRDAWNLFECELREGRLAQLTRTASDGSFVRGERALPHLLGAAVGRYAVTVGQGSLKFAFEGSLDDVLARGAEALGAELDALSYPGLSRVARVVFDEDAQAALAQQSPQGMRPVVARLLAGETPEALVADGMLGRETLEAVLLDMGRRGAIREVLDANGSDLVAEARLARVNQVVPCLSSPLSMMPQSELEPPSVAVAEPPTVEIEGARIPSLGAFAQESEGAEASVDADTTEEGPVSSASISAQGGPSHPEQRRDGETVTPSLVSTHSAPHVHVHAGKAGHSDSASDDGTEQELVETSRSRSTLVAWAAALVGLFAVAFFAERMLEPEASSDHLEAIGDPSTAQGAPTDDAQEQRALRQAGEPDAILAAPRAEKDTAIQALVLPEDSGFQIYSGILEPGLVTSPEQGLLVVEASAGFAQAELFVDRQKVGTLPAKVALSEGIHELAIESGDATRYRFVFTRPGKTWVLRKP